MGFTKLKSAQLIPCTLPPIVTINLNLY